MNKTYATIGWYPAAILFFDIHCFESLVANARYRYCRESLREELRGCPRRYFSVGYTFMRSAAKVILPYTRSPADFPYNTLDTR